MGLFITLAEPTAPMKKEAASAGVLDTPFGKFARLPVPGSPLIARAEPLAPAPLPGLHELVAQMPRHAIFALCSAREYS